MMNKLEADPRISTRTLEAWYLLWDKARSAVAFMADLRSRHGENEQNLKSEDPFRKGLSWAELNDRQRADASSILKYLTRQQVYELKRKIGVTGRVRQERLSEDSPAVLAHVGDRFDGAERDFVDQIIGHFRGDLVKRV